MGELAQFTSSSCRTFASLGCLCRVFKLEHPQKEEDEVLAVVLFVVVAVLVLLQVFQKKYA